MELVSSAAKRPREEDPGGALAAPSSKRPAAGIPRTSTLEAPTMLLTGHADSVNCLKYSPDGGIIASGSADRHIFLWNARTCEDLMWTYDGSKIVSGSADKSVRAWDAETGQQSKKMSEHTSFVNSVCTVRRGPQLIVSASDDGTARLWDLRVKGSQQTITEKFQVTAACFSEAADRVFTGSVDNEVRCWDLRKAEVVFTLSGHLDTITGMALSPDGSHLLTNAMDSTLRSWDVRPFAPEQRCVSVFTGHAHNFEKNLLKCAWAPDGRSVSCGSADRQVYIWSTETKALLYKLPGHKGSVNEVVFSPKEAIVASCSTDKTIYLGELA